MTLYFPDTAGVRLLRVSTTYSSAIICDGYIESKTFVVRFQSLLKYDDAIYCMLYRFPSKLHTTRNSGAWQLITVAWRCSDDIIFSRHCRIGVAPQNIIPAWWILIANCHCSFLVAFEVTIQCMLYRFPSEVRCSGASKAFQIDNASVTLYFPEIGMRAWRCNFFDRDRFRSILKSKCVILTLCK